MENIPPHPSTFIESEDISKIRNTAADAEQIGTLHPEQLRVIYKHEWFKLLIPRIYGGLQMTLPNLVRLQEAVSWADGSTGWVVTLCSGAGWFGGFISPEVAEQVLRQADVCLAGSGAPDGTADITPSGYIINGTWKYASGAHHATHFTANCIIRKGGQTALDEGGQPLILPFIFDKKDVSILPSWKYVGMAATGSDAFEIKNLNVASNRQFKINPAASIIPDALYRFPFVQLAEATLSVNLSGIAIHFIDLCDDIFRQKIKHPRLSDEQKAFLMYELNLSKNDINSSRKEFFEAVDQSWETNGYQQLNKLSATSHRLAHLARQIVDRLYPLCGLAAACTDTEINRAWRDLHTASQHALLTFASNES